MIIDSLTQIKAPPLFYLMNEFVPDIQLYLKLEGLNIAGSIKLKPALWMLQALERSQKLTKGKSTVICSSSGNLGIALSIACKQEGYSFICVSDPNIPTISEKIINLYGGQVIKVTQRDKNGGFLATRLQLIKTMTEEDESNVFVDQYANEENANAHYITTAYEILNEIPNVNYLFIGAGTTGTLMGCIKLFRSVSPNIKIIAVDAVGSVTFGFSPAKRYIPGLGTSFKPPLADMLKLDHVLRVKEVDTINMCHALLKHQGLFLGGSSATVLQGVKQYSSSIPKGSVVVAISPDFGDRYLQTLYNKQWLEEKFPELGPVPTSGVF